jgi:conjugal transfer pilus assembly protein TraW
MMLITLMGTEPLYATVRHLEALGETYPVTEEDMLPELKERAMMAEEFRATTQEYLDEFESPAIHHLPRATTDRTFTVDMTYTVEEDIIDDGELIYPKGYRFNPLKHVPLRSPLVAIDGDDPSQVEWFKASPYSADRGVRLLISSGRADDLMDRLDRSVYYLTDDMAQRMQIKAVPSLIIQQGLTLQVREIFLPQKTSRSNERK